MKDKLALRADGSGCLCWHCDAAFTLLEVTWAQPFGWVMEPLLTEFRQPLQVMSHLEMPGILVQLGHIQRT